MEKRKAHRKKITGCIVLHYQQIVVVDGISGTRNAENLNL